MSILYFYIPLILIMTFVALMFVDWMEDDL